MILKHLTDDQLIKDTKKLIAHELECLVAILIYFKEIESRKLFSEYRYPSMLEFVVHELGYSIQAGSRRIQSSRLLAEFPQIETKITNGNLSITNLYRAACYFRKEKISDSSQKLSVLIKLENKSCRDCEKILFELTPKALPSESIRQVSLNYVQLKINIKEDTHKELDNLKCFLGFHLIDDSFFSAITKEAFENVERKRFKLTDKGRETHSKTRVPSNYDKRTAYENSEKVCEMCGGLFLLQEDHREPYAQGGSSEAGNLRLLCYHCNQRARMNARL